MKILFSPSEAKSFESPLNGSLKESLSSLGLFDIQSEVIEKYNLFLDKSSKEELSKLLGLKKDVDIKRYKPIDIDSSFLQLAILRYSGVGYDYLDFNSLKDEHKKVLFDSLLIFSNLFGILRADDKIPLYKIKQGECIDGFDTAKYYKKHLTTPLDKLLKDELVIDLRAGFYEKFYTPTMPYISLKFLKNGKSVSHFAKAYRGIVAKELCIHNPKNEKEFKDMVISNLHVKEIQIKGKKTLYIYDIID